MARSDKFVGLNRKGHNFIKTLESEGKVVKRETYEMGRLAFMDERMNGVIIYVKPNNPDVNESEFFIEKVQHNPWHSGPIYFTCFQHYLQKKCGDTIDFGLCYQWIRDPLLDGAYDIEEGSFNI